VSNTPAISRQYSKSHSWLTFSLDLRQAPASLWVLLGECQSKCEHIAGVPLRPAEAQRLYLLYLAKGVSATTAIEGNTLSEQQVLDHLKGQLKLPLSQEYLKQEIDNILAGCNLIHDDINQGRHHPLTTERIRELNRIVLDKLTLDEHVTPGNIRNYSVGVANYRGAPAEDCEYLLDRLCEWLNGSAFSPPKDSEIMYATLKAVIAHLYLAWIHPFGDGNGRTARLIEFQILMCSGVPAPAAHLLSNHYNQTRTQYYQQLDNASRSGGNVIPFIHYAIQGFVDGLRSQLHHIREQQWNVAWQNYVHNSFKDKSSPTAERQRRLVLDLSVYSEPVPLNKLTEISVRIAKAYANKTNRTLVRDLNKLLEMGLIKRDTVGYRANKELILAFLPVKAVTKSTS
jgi:Fic family protein